MTVKKDSNNFVCQKTPVQKYARPYWSNINVMGLSFILTPEEEKYLVITIPEPFLSKKQDCWFSGEE